MTISENNEIIPTIISEIFSTPIQSTDMEVEVKLKEEIVDKLIIDDKLYICENCIDKHNDVLYLSSLPSNHIKEMTLLSHSEITINIENKEDNLVLEKDFNEKITNSNAKFNFDYKCCDCFKIIKGTVNISTENHDLILCLDCIKDHSNKIEFPQIYYSFNHRIKLSFYQKHNLPKINFSSSVYEVVQTNAYSAELIIHHSFVNKLKQIMNSKQTIELHKKWCLLKNDQLISLNELKDEYFELNSTGNMSLSNQNLIEFLTVFLY